MFKTWHKSKPIRGEEDIVFDIPMSQYDVLETGELARLAETADTDAMFSLAVRAQGGADGRVDYLAGKSWLERAAKTGHIKSMCRLAHMYLFGTAGESKDLTKASDWGRRASDAGSAWGNFWLGYIDLFELNDKHNAKIWLSRARQYAFAGAQKDCTESMTALAALCAEKWCGTYDPALAAHWCRKAAFRGEPYAMESMALMYVNSRGVRRNLALARIWFQRAVQRNWVRAFTPFANMLIRGEGGPPDRETAVGLLKRRAQAGDELAIASLASI